MKIQYCSDLHLEFERNKNYLSNKPLIISGEILILAGDIIPMQYEFFNNSFFNFISDNFKQVFWVPGNHEFYYLDIAKFSKSYNFQIRNNINIVNNIELEYENIRLIFSTLWSKIHPENENNIEKRVSDFNIISINNKKLKTQDYNCLHNDSLDFIKHSLSSNHQKTVVITHHLPSVMCNSPAHRNSILNEAFCVDLTTYIESCNANFWIYGHSHFNQKPLHIGNTILLTNQLGYVEQNEHEGFKHNAYFSI